MKHQVRQIYVRLLLPILRNCATPCFRLAVKIAVALRMLPRPVPLSLGRPERFLIVHLSSHIGDTVMLFPMIEALRAAHPDRSIECAVEAPMDSLLHLLPCVDRVYTFHLGQGATTTPWAEVRRAIAIILTYRRTMHDARPTVCIVPRWGCGFRDLMLSYITQAPTRIGFAAADFLGSREPATYRDALLTHTVRGAAGMADPEKFVFLVKQADLIPPNQSSVVGARPIASLLHVAESVDWRALARRLNLDPDVEFAVIAPGATAARRIWPIERWAVVIEKLHRNGYTVVLLAGKQDAHIVHRLSELIPADRQDRMIVAGGVTDIPESACLLAHACLYLGNDSGPGHLAGALGIPCVILFITPEGADPNGPSAPERIRPMGRQLVCCRPAAPVPPCSDYCIADSAHCITTIQSEDVLEAVRPFLRRSHYARTP